MTVAGRSACATFSIVAADANARRSGSGHGGGFGTRGEDAIESLLQRAQESLGRAQVRAVRLRGRAQHFGQQEVVERVEPRGDLAAAIAIERTHELADERACAPEFLAVRGAVTGVRGLARAL